MFSEADVATLNGGEIMRVEDEYGCTFEWHGTPGHAGGPHIRVIVGGNEIDSFGTHTVAPGPFGDHRLPFTVREFLCEVNEWVAEW